MKKSKYISSLAVACLLMAGTEVFAAEEAHVNTFDELKSAIYNAVPNIYVEADIASPKEIIQIKHNADITLTGVKKYNISSDSKEPNTAFELWGDPKEAGSPTFTIENLSFKNFVSDSGGVLQVEKGTARVKNSTFTNNQALNKHTADELAYGGAIDLYDGSLYIEDSEFIQNYSRRGGAIGLKDPAVDVLEKAPLSTISGSTFTENSVIVAGGAVDNHTRLDISNSTFISNRQHWTDPLNPNNPDRLGSGGGAISNIGLLVLKETNTFEANSSCFNAGAILNLASVDSVL